MCAFPGTSEGTEKVIEAQNMICKAHKDPGEKNNCGVGYERMCEENQRQLWYGPEDVVAFAYVQQRPHQYDQCE